MDIQNKSLLVRFAFVFLLSFTGFTLAFSQPQYYTSSQSGGSTPYPLNHGYNKAQWLYPPNAFHIDGNQTKASSPYGSIKTIYFRLGNQVDTLDDYIDLNIKLGQTSGVDSAWQTDSFHSTLHNVYIKRKVTLIGKSQEWLEIELPNAFVYDPNKSLILEISSRAGKGIELQAITTTRHSALIGSYGAVKAYSRQQFVPNLGFDLYQRPIVNAGIVSPSLPSLLSPGKQDIMIDVINNGRTIIDSVQINYRKSGGSVQSFWYNNAIDTFDGTGNHIHSVKVTTDTLKRGNTDILTVWTSMPNNATDPYNADDSVQLSLSPAMTGQYRVGKNNADFANLTNLHQALFTNGVCGPVTITIDSGTYREPLLLQGIAGTNDSNTIVVDGQNNKHCIIEHQASSAADQQTVLLKAVDHVTLKNLHIKATGTNYGIGVQLVHANHNIVKNCVVELPVSQNNNRLVGVCGSGTSYNVITPGFAGNHNRIEGNTITGGGNGIVYTGFDTSRFSSHTVIKSNSISKFDQNGIILQSVNHSLVNANQLIGIDSIAKGISLDHCNSPVITQNNILSVDYGFITSNINRYKYVDSVPAEFTNNMFNAYRFGSMLNNGNHIRFYHNTIQTNGGFTASFAGLDSTYILNNIFHNTLVQNVFYANDSGGLNQSNQLDYNVYYARFATSATNTVEYGKTKYKTVNAWFKADTTINANSRYVQPSFKSSSDLHIDSSGHFIGLYVDVTRDIDNDLRCNMRPSIGADQYIRGRIADTLKPDVICNTGCIKYHLPTPSPFLNSNYGSAWTIDSISVRTVSGYTSKNFQLVAPSSSSDAYISFCPDSTEVDSAFYLFLIFRDLLGQHCFETFTSYILVGPKPNAQFTVTQKDICLGDTIWVNSVSKHSPSDSIIHYLGDGSHRVDASFYYVYDSFGFYDITKVTKANGCVDSSKVSISVGTTKGANLVQGSPYKGRIKKGKLNDPDILCSDDTTYYQIFPPKTINRFAYDSLWKVDWVRLNTLQGKAVNDMLTFNPDSFNNFRIRIFPSNQLLQDTLVLEARIVSLINSVCDTTLTRYIVLRQTPKLAITHTPICLGQQVYFEDTSHITTIIDRLWLFGDGYRSTLESDTHTYRDTGTYTLTFTASSSNGCHGYIEKDIIIKPRNKPNISWDDSCMRNDITFWDSTYKVTPVKSFSWFFGDGTWGKGQRLEHRYYNYGLYDVILVTQDTNNCTDTSQTVVGIYKHPTAGFNVNATCKFDSVRLFNSTTDTFETTYLWQFGDGQSSTSVHPTHVFGDKDSVGVRLIAFNKSCPDTAFKTIVFDTIPETSFSVNTLSSYRIKCVPKDSVGLSFKWYFGDGDSSSLVSPEHTYPTGVKQYTIRCLIKNGKGCVYETTDTVTVGTGKAPSFLTSDLSIYPNPFTSIIVVDLSLLNATTLNVRLLDVTGKAVATKLDWGVQTELVTITPSKQLLPAGIYFVEVVTTKGLIREKLLSIE